MLVSSSVALARYELLENRWTSRGISCEMTSSLHTKNGQDKKKMWHCMHVTSKSASSKHHDVVVPKSVYFYLLAIAHYIAIYSV